jgi:thiol-disulfide isomerase/thioredoxin
MVDGGWRMTHRLLGFWLLVLALGSSAAELKVIKEQPMPRSEDIRLSQAIAAHQGKPVLVNFWATWCEPCREEMPSLSRLEKRWQEASLAVITVAVADNAKRVEDFLWEALPENTRLPVVHDRDQIISRAWGARMLPTTLVLDRKHRLVGRGLGAIDWDSPAADQTLKTLIH